MGEKPRSENINKPYKFTSTHIIYAENQKKAEEEFNKSSTSHISIKKCTCLHLSWEDFVKTYLPVKNIIVDNSPMGGYMFETFDKELEFIKSQPNECVWTLVDEEGKQLILPGKRIVNRLGYFVTEISWWQERDEMYLIVEP